MKPAPFEYLAPESLGEALEALSEYGDEAKLLAGGQSLIPVMNFRLARPAVLVDLNRVDELEFLRIDEGFLSIGALTRQSRLEHDPCVTELSPLLAQAVPHIAHPQIRNRGTVGGTLAHADPAAEMPAVALALGARLRLRSLEGDRWVEAASFFRGLFSTAMRPDEILVEIQIPVIAPRTGCAFLEIARRHGDYALAGVAAVVTLGADGRCSDATLVYLSVGDQPLHAERASRILLGETGENALFEAAAEAAGSEIEPVGDIHASADFKRHLATVLTRRALRAAFERARQAGDPS